MWKSMAKVNQEEYELLKGLDDKWKWIARDTNGDYSGNLFVYLEKTFKDYDEGYWGCCGGIHPIDNQLFQFIQWEDEEPYNIQELIEEYEGGGVEVKKDIKWLNNEVEKRIKKIRTDEVSFAGSDFFDEGYIHGMKDVKAIANQLDESEVLTEYWIEQKSIDTHVDTLSGDVQVTLRMDDLQDLVVPKQELPVIPKYVADFIEETKKQKQNNTLVYAIMHIYDKNEIGKSPNKEEKRIFQWMELADNDEVFARAWLDLDDFTVEEEQKYIIKIGNLYLAEPLGDMTSDIVRMTRDKEVAYQFTDEKSIATHLDKFEGTEAVKVEEMGE